MHYNVVFSDKAKKDLKALKKSEPQIYKKAKSLIYELSIHPRVGTGKPTIKKHDLAGLYARKITNKHRLVYSIDDNILTIEVISAKGHYQDK